jgi:polysaccharide export outer membrane protein
MKRLLACIMIIAAACISLKAQQEERKHIPISMADILRYQADSASAGSSMDINERLRAMAGAIRFSQDYLLGPGDVIEVSVFGIEELQRKELTLDSGGNVSLPFLKDVRLIGLTPRESEVKIAALYEASVMKNPQVSVSVKEYRSQFINVLGAVENPGIYQLTRRIFLVDALAMAGGLLTEKAASTVYVQRAASADLTLASTDTPSGSSDRIEVDLDRLLHQGDISQNIPIYAGDSISVPERVERYYYVLGDVNRGGAFELKPGESITLSQALASAGGLMSTAKSSRSTIMRQKEDGGALQIPVDIKKVLKGESQDMELAGNDVVFIPGSTTKTIGKTVLNSFGSIVYALIIGGMR